MSWFLYELYLCLFHRQVEDNDEAADYGISLLPALVYFENRIPSLYDADLAKVRLLDLSITITCKLHKFFPSARITKLVAFPQL